MNDMPEFAPQEGEVIQPSRAMSTPGFGDVDQTPAFSSMARAGQGTMVEQARAIAEVRAAVSIAMERPRDINAALLEMRQVCQIQSLAERAFFRVQRGKAKEKDDKGRDKWVDNYVNGASIHLARELARCWGNINYGHKELVNDQVRGQSEMLVFAWDMQTNARSETTFIVPHKKGSGDRARLLTGTQEIYENNASFAGRRLREAIFAVLPVWLKDEAQELCHRTLQRGNGKPISEQVKACCVAFGEIGVTVAQLEKKVGRAPDNMTPEDLALLRVVLKSIKRNEVTVAEEFPVEATPQTIEAPRDADPFEAASSGMHPVVDQPKVAAKSDFPGDIPDAEFNARARK